MTQNIYFNEDCSGTPLVTNPDVCATGNYTSCTSSCGSSGECDTVTAAYYNDTECTGDSFFNFELIADYCLGGSMYSCAGGNVQQTIYNNSDCSDDGISIEYPNDECYFNVVFTGCAAAAGTPTGAPTLPPVFNDLTCDGVVINFQGSFESALPGGVCLANGESGTSTFGQCQDGIAMTMEYDNLDCSGDPTETIDTCEDFASDSFGFASCRGYCGIGACEYAVIREYYNVDSCDGDEPVGGDDMYYEENALTLNYCSVGTFNSDGGNKITSNETHLLLNTYSSQDCSGSGTEEESMMIGMTCEADSNGANATMIIVGTAEYTPPPTTTDPTTSPVATPSPVETPSPEEPVETPSPEEPSTGGAQSLSLIGLICVVLSANTL
eukprot:CAMPEP_0201585954 /NCGR_PEP_ID=MMETSP0190_2-20130828/127354_1 /ASSEMBLY_ACC=CAM_ASM_000263 /TAXON_ID=37353 /ORGANISM="Rosalina sp." /LENGTH=381 /DNA_ID=CAMNT_0048032867 /DNA_START=222 /DNA_END=1367 /DNA_ORIENTATION=+